MEMTAENRGGAGESFLKLDGRGIEPRSVIGVDGAELRPSCGQNGPRLEILVPSGSPVPSGFHGGFGEDEVIMDGKTR